MNQNEIYIIAEIGVTCNYDLDITKKLIKASKESGANAVKFVFHFPDELMSDKNILYTYKTTKGDTTENMFNMFESLRFTLKEWYEIKNECEKNDIDFFASVDCNSGIEWGEKLDLKYYKLGTWDVSDTILLKKLAALNKPIIIDVGASPEEEIEEMINIIGPNNTIILHDYHTNVYSEMNMLTIPYLREKYNIITGFSSPGSYDVNDYIAVSLGAKVIEKRLTLSRDLEGHHHILSKSPSEFKQWVDNIRNAEASMGKKGVYPSKHDIIDREKWFKHICAEVDIPKGTIISEDMMACKRPASAGLAPKHWDSLIGKKLNKDIKRNEAITLKNTMEVYGIGLPRTGTTSLSFALEILGLDSHHHCVINNSNNESNSTIMVNNSFYKNYRELFTNNPDSKFILTVRDSHEWEVSMAKQLQLIGGENNTPNINEYNSEIIRFFEENDGNLLILDIFKENSKDIWSKLCNFLDIKTPKLKFPHEIKK